jgi:asparagine N-glycosylation enzyme membrane subunit Stt3
MDAQNDFFTWQSLATFTGTTMATTGVTNGLRRAFPKLSGIPWLGLAIALIICVLISLIDFSSSQISFDKPFATYFIAVVNGFFVFASAAGVTAGADAAINPQSATEKVARGQVSETPNAIGRSSSFWQRWF